MLERNRHFFCDLINIFNTMVYIDTMDEIFQISDSHRIFFEAEGDKLEYPKGRIASWSNDKQSWAYFLSSGCIKTFCSYTDGSDKILGYLQPGSTFSQASSAFDHGGRGEMEFFALQDCVIYRVRVEDFWARIQTDKAFSNDFLMMQLRDEMMMVDHIIFLGEHDLERRFASWLLMMAKFYGKAEGTGVIITMPQTQNEIAAWLGVRRETVSKLMKIFNGNGFISLKQKRLIIHSPKRLEDFL
jgi:CRP-like cAMP-binding protein